MEKKIKSYIREKGLLDSTNVIIGLPFIKEVMEYPNSDKLKPLHIGPCNGNKDLVNHVQTF